MILNVCNYSLVKSILGDIEKLKLIDNKLHFLKLNPYI
jgi:hypothetical protein